MRFNLTVLCLFFFALSASVSAQTNPGYDAGSTGSSEPKNWQLRGYVKSLQSFNLVPDLDALYLSELLHNRLNFRYFAGDHFIIGIEQRNRMFIGSDVILNPQLHDQLEVDPGLVDLSFVIWDNNNALLHTITDRIWVQYQGEKFETRIGRQRVNWGQSTIWNPNDVFNAYNYLDFDYEERPGKDAVLTTFFVGDLSSLDFVYAPSDTSEGHIAAVRYLTNTHGYDFQFIGAWRLEDLMAGMGWAGNIGNSGFRGEASLFVPTRGATDSANIFTTSVDWDYSFQKPVYLHASGLFNSDGTSDMLNLGALSTFSDLSVKRLMPTRWSAFGGVNWQTSPLIGLDLSVIYGFGSNLMVVFPSVSISVASNWDLLGTAQFFYLEDQTGFGNPFNAWYIRLKWSY